jgi:hypothetical protein
MKTITLVVNQPLDRFMITLELSNHFFERDSAHIRLPLITIYWVINGASSSCSHVFRCGWQLHGFAFGNYQRSTSILKWVHMRANLRFVFERMHLVRRFSKGSPLSFRVNSSLAEMHSVLAGTEFLYNCNWTLSVQDISTNPWNWFPFMLTHSKTYLHLISLFLLIQP